MKIYGIEEIDPVKDDYKKSIDLFFTRYKQKSTEIRGSEISPQWGKKEGFLLKQDLDRLGGKNLMSCIELFFSDQVHAVAQFTRYKNKAGYSYGVFHGCLDKLLMCKEKPRLPCEHCGGRGTHLKDCKISIENKKEEKEREKLAREIRDTAERVDLMGMFKRKIQEKENEVKT